MRLQQTSHTHPTNSEPLMGPSPAMRHVLEQVARAAAGSLHVLISGEPGTGREMIARALHAQSRWAGGPFVKVDCAKNPPQDLEATLFATTGRGHANVERRTIERVRRTAQLFQSKGGTLFLQNVADIPARVQLRLTRVLRDREVLIMDDGTHLELDHRMITAADQSFEAASNEGRILPDLYKRLCGFRVDLPPLRNRKEDIPILAEHFARAHCARANIPPKTLSDAAQSVLAALPWKGNAPELRALVEGLVSRVQGEVIGLDDVLAHVHLDGRATWFAVGGSLKQARARFEAEYIAAVVAQHHGRIPEAAKTLGIQRSNLYRKMRTLKIRQHKRPPGTSSQT